MQLSRALSVAKSEMPRIFCKEIAEDDEEKACLTKCDRDGEDDDDGDDSTVKNENDNANQRPKEYTANDVSNDKGQSSNSQTSFHVLNLIQGDLQLNLFLAQQHCRCKVGPCQKVNN